MIKSIDYKPENGKLIRIDVEIIDDIIKKISITGDFFMYPEEGIVKIEESLLNKNITQGQEIIESIDRAIKDNGIKVIGFNSDDILVALIQDRKLRVAVAQMDVSLGDKGSNIKKIESFIVKASGKDADIICFPEYFTTGSIPTEFDDLFETIPGKSTDILCRLAKDNKISIIGSLIEKNNGQLYNTAIFIDFKGKLIGMNRKSHMFLLEGVYVTSGSDCNIVNTDFGTFGLMVCYDAIFPEVARKLALKGSKIIFVPSNWPNPFLSQWRLATSARALDNQVWVVAVNRCGKDNDFEYFGKSRVIDPYGETIAECEDNEDIAFVDIDLRRSNEFKQKVNFLKDLKPIISLK